MWTKSSKARQDDSAAQGEPLGHRLLDHLQYAAKRPVQLREGGRVYIYRQLRASEPPDEATARDVIEKLFFSDKRYDLGDVGRYRINKKLDWTPIRPSAR